MSALARLALALACLMFVGALSARAIADEGRATPPIPSDYGVLDNGWIRVAFHPSLRAEAPAIVDRVSAIREVLLEDLETDVLAQIELRIAAVPAEVATLSPGEVAAGDTIATWPAAHLVVVSGAARGDAAREALAMRAAQGAARVALAEARGRGSMPEWMVDAYVAGITSGTPYARLIGAAITGEKIEIADLARAADSAPVAAHAMDFVRFLRSARAGHARRRAWPALLVALRDGEPFDAALPAAVGARDRAEIDVAWRRQTAFRYAFVPAWSAAILLAAAGCGVLVARRRRATNTPQPPRDVRDADAGARAKPRARARIRTETSVILIRKPDVPKVRHDGSWHTLH